MLHTDTRFASSVEAAVAKIEATTDAEIVVVAAPRSGSYRDVAALFGVVIAWLVLLVVLFAPFEFRPFLIPVELPVVGALAAWVAHRSPGLMRLLSSAARRRAQVEDAAAAAFHQEVVHGTRGRTGLLVYLSALEDRVVLVPDLGLDAKVPHADWNAIHWGADKDPQRPQHLDSFLAGLRAAGQVLAARVPPTGDNPNEISDAPRIRP